MAKAKSFSKLIEESLNAYSKDWKTYALMVLAFLTLPVAMLYFSDPLTLVPVIGLLILIPSGIALTISIIGLGANTLKKKKTTVADINKLIKEKFWPLLATIILEVLVAVVVIIPFIALLLAVSAIGETITAMALIFIIAALGFIALILTGILLTFTDYIVIVGKHKYFAALKESYNLVKKKFWPRTGTIIAIHLINAVISTIVMIMLGLVFFWIPSTILIILALLANALVGVIFKLIFVKWYQEL